MWIEEENMNNMEALFIEYPDVIQYKITVGKKRRGRWRTPFNINLSVDKDFCKKFNPKLPDWKNVAVFKGEKIGCGSGGCGSCKQVLYGKLGFTIYEEEDPDYNSGNCFNKIFKFDDNDKYYLIRGFLEWQPGIPDHSMEIGVLKEITRSLKKDVTDALLEAYNSVEIEERNILLDEDEIKENEQQKSEKTTKRKVNIN